MNRIDTKQPVPPGRTGELAAVDLIWFLSPLCLPLDGGTNKISKSRLSVLLWSETNVHFLQREAVICSFSTATKRKPACSHFPFSQANYKAGGEAGGGSTVWRRDISVLLSNSLLESQLGASSSCHPCLQFAFHFLLLPSFLSSYLFFYFMPTSFLLFLFSFLCSIKHRFSFLFSSGSPRFLPTSFSDFWYAASDYTARENRNIKSIKHPLLVSLVSRWLLITGAGRSNKSLRRKHLGVNTPPPTNEGARAAKCVCWYSHRDNVDHQERVLQLYFSTFSLSPSLHPLTRELLVRSENATRNQETAALRGFIGVRMSTCDRLQLLTRGTTGRTKLTESRKKKTVRIKRWGTLRRINHRELQVNRQ